MLLIVCRVVVVYYVRHDHLCLGHTDTSRAYCVKENQIDQHLLRFVDLFHLGEDRGTLHCNIDLDLLLTVVLLIQLSQDFCHLLLILLCLLDAGFCCYCQALVIF